MTTLRPERPADGPMSYEDTGQFAAVVQQLSDPLNDPLPGRPPAVPDGEPRTAPGYVSGPAPQMPDLRDGSAPRVRERGPVAPPPFYDRPTTADQPSAPGGGSPWFRGTGRTDELGTGGAEPPGPGSLQPDPGWPASVPPASTSPAPGRPEPYAPEAAQGFAPQDAGVSRAAYAPVETPRPEAYTRPDPSTRDTFAPAGPAGQAGVVPPESPAAPGTAGPREFAPSEPGRRPQGPRRGLAETAQIPVVAAGAAPGRTAHEQAAHQQTAQGQAAQDGLLLAGEVPGSPPAAHPEDGGRAARRKAARQGGHRSRAHGAGPGAPADLAGDPSAPLSRIEARRAAKAAKDSPSVVISRVLGEVFITTGLIMLLFVTYQLWWSNIRAHQQANSASNKLEHQWDDTTASDPSRAAGTFSPGQGFAIMYIPKLDVKAPIAQGVDKTSVLDKGMIGHYDGSLNTAMPWDKTGNFAVAAHRNTHGEPFRYINRLVAGDKVVVETATTYYTYEITTAMASTPPSNISVLQPVPPGSGFTQPGRYLTLTTCTPEFTSTNRLIVWGKLIEERPRSKGKPDALVQG